jgi:Fe2+ transport system protein FeoA
MPNENAGDKLCGAKAMKTVQSERCGWLQRLRRRRQEHEEHEAGCTALCCAHSGQTLCVRRLAGEPCEAACLRDIGLREGAVVTVVRHGDPLLVRIGDARFGIGRAAAERILCHLPETAPAPAASSTIAPAEMAPAEMAPAEMALPVATIPYAENA